MADVDTAKLLEPHKSALEDLAQDLAGGRSREARWRACVRPARRQRVFVARMDVTDGVRIDLT
jgi:hypothetical protein